MRRRFPLALFLFLLSALTGYGQSAQTYTGCLDSSEEGFLLTANGRRIGLTGDVDFNKHLGRTVKVTGEQRGPLFAVISLDHVSAECDQGANPAAVPEGDAKVHQNGVQERANVTAPTSENQSAVAQAEVATTTNEQAVNARDRAPIIPNDQSDERSAELSGDRNVAQNDQPARPPSDLDAQKTVDPRSDVEPRADVDVGAQPQVEEDHDVVKDRDQGVTADNQSNKKADRKTTAAIRKAIVKDDSLSTYAHNVKIITQDGRVTLRGPVRSPAEKAAVAAKAGRIAGAGAVVDQMTVEPDSDADPHPGVKKEK